MRSLVLNIGSVSGLSVDRGTLAQWRQDVVSGVGRLVDQRVAQPELRTREGIHQIRCSADLSLFEVARDLLRAGSRDEYEFFLAIAGQSPWTEGLRPEIVERFRSCEEQTLALGDGEPLMLCVSIGGIAVGFPSSDLWDTDRIPIRFDELLPDGSIQECTEEIDNLTRSAHSRVIAERHRAALRSCADAGELWRRRCEVFPHLRLGPGVEANLSRLGGHLSGVAEKLASLDAAAAEWRDAGGDAPRWRTEVTSESESLRKNRKLLDRRRFPSGTGRRELFEWHGRYGSGGRIHLRLDRDSREIEIGYIGPHLRL